MISNLLVNLELRAEGQEPLQAYPLIIGLPSVQDHTAKVGRWASSEEPKTLGMNDLRRWMTSRLAWTHPDAVGWTLGMPLEACKPA